MMAGVPPPPPPRPNVSVNNVRALRRIDMAPDLIFDPDQFIGRSIAFLGASRSGKSTTVRRALEQCIKCGIPFAIADIEQEYATLKEVGEVLIAGPKIEHGKISIDIALTNEKQYHSLGRRAYLERKSVILMLGDLDDDTARLMLNAFLEGLFYAANDPDARAPFVLAIEEIQEWAPQVGISKDDPLLKMIVRISKRGLKRGINLWCISQRPSNVDKNIVTQCSMFFAHSINFTTDMNAYRALFSLADLETRVNAMNQGDVVFKNGKTEIITHVSLPGTTSPSTTPGAVDPSKFKTVVGAQEMNAEIAREENIEGVSTIPTAELHTLRERSVAVDELQHALAQAISVQNHLDERIKAMEAERAAAVTHVSEGVDVGALQAQMRDLQARLARAEATAAPIQLLLGLLDEYRRKES